MSYKVMGVDPGPSTGIALLGTHPWTWMVLQVNGERASGLCQILWAVYQPEYLAIEKFIPSNRAGTTGKDAELTRRIVHEISRDFPAHGTVFERSAAMVKPWASDKRLLVTKFPMGPKFKDARDAGRHALFCAVNEGRVSDPLA